MIGEFTPSESETDRQARLAYIGTLIDQAKLFAQYWIACAETGVCSLAKTQRGRKPTDEELRAGVTISWRELAEIEKKQDALKTAKAHIHRMGELADYRDQLLREVIR